MKYLNLTLFTLLIILGCTFGIQNSKLLTLPISVKLNLWLLGFESIPIPFAVLLVLVFLLGFLVASVWLFLHEVQLRREIRRKKVEIRGLNQELQQLRQQIVLNEPAVEESKEVVHSEATASASSY